VSTVFIPAVLRPNVGGVKSLELDGDSIRDVVGALVEQHPSLGRFVAPAQPPEGEPVDLEPLRIPVPARA